jgi:hypothetical protein
MESAAGSSSRQRDTLRGSSYSPDYGAAGQGGGGGGGYGASGSGYGEEMDDADEMLAGQMSGAHVDRMEMGGF